MYGDRRCAVAGASLWNELSNGVGTAKALPQFRVILKTSWVAFKLYDNMDFIKCTYYND